MNTPKKLFMVVAALLAVVVIGVGLALSLGGESGVTVAAAETAEGSESDTSSDDTEESSAGDEDTEAGAPATAGSDLASLEEMQQCLQDNGMEPEDFAGIDPDSIDPNDLDIRVEDGEFYVTINGKELNMSDLLVCLPEDLSSIPGMEDLDLGGLDLGGLDLEDLDLGDLDLGDLDLGDLDLGDLDLGDLDLGDLDGLTPEDLGVDMGELEDCFDSDFMDNLDFEAILEDPEGFTTGLPEACQGLFGG